MKLVSFSISNYRSITKAHKIPFDSSTILIGKNNEGKSNVLKALSLCMNSLTRHARREDRLIFHRSMMGENEFDWERDYPVSLRGRKNRKHTKLLLEFQLTNDEIEKFKQAIGSNLNGLLPLEITYYQNAPFKIKVNKKGPVQAVLSKKSDKIAQFIAEKIEYNYIPAVRTDKDALHIIERMLSLELLKLEEDEEYQEALAKISELQAPVLKDLSDEIHRPLAEFIPSIRGVSVEIPDVVRRRSLRRDINVIIDDGTPTQIEYKGDGVKSLAALALLRARPSRASASIIAFEEPESHLHPSAIHQLRDIIYELSTNNQVIVSTHNPLFVDRQQVKSNILIGDGKVKPAQSIDKIREMLGVKVSDNLIHASLVLIVEGPSDSTSIEPILREMSTGIAEALSKNNLVIVPIGGASKLNYQLTLYSNALCDSIVFFDDDDDGRMAVREAKQNSNIKDKHVFLTSHRGFKNAEFEDLICKDVYESALQSELSINLSEKTFRGSGHKWSDRLRNTFKQQGKPWDKKIESKAKSLVAKEIAKAGAQAVKPEVMPVIKGLVEAIEKCLTRNN